MTREEKQRARASARIMKDSHIKKDIIFTDMGRDIGEEPYDGQRQRRQLEERKTDGKARGHGLQRKTVQLPKSDDHTNTTVMLSPSSVTPASPAVSTRAEDLSQSPQLGLDPQPSASLAEAHTTQPMALILTPRSREEELEPLEELDLIDGGYSFRVELADRSEVEWVDDDGRSRRRQDGLGLWGGDAKVKERRAESQNCGGAGGGFEREAPEYSG